MRLDRRVQLIAGVVLAGSVVASGLLSMAASAIAGRSQLNYTDRAQEGDPPEVAVGIALGAFRGLFVNMLWIRATKLKQEGKFHESVELARTITRLQPRFPRVWGFHAWNLAYNISVATQTQEERWHWVQAGIRLLRDEGIPKNPNDMLLHKELAWIFVHKIQGINDDANQFYKKELAKQWQIILGPPPPKGETRAESVERFASKLERIARAPATLDALYKEAPRARELVERLEAARIPLDEQLLRLSELRRAQALTFEREGVATRLSPENENSAFDEILLTLRDDKELSAAFAGLITHVRRRVLEDDYHMSPTLMATYTRRFGPLDWRHPASHGVYWATLGVERALQRRNVEDFDQTNTDRLIMHAVQELFRWGLVYFDMLNDTNVQMVDTDFAETYGRILREEIDQRATKFEDPHRAKRTLSTGYMNFLADVSRTFYRMGEYKLAAEYFEKFRTYEFMPINNVEFVENAKLSLKDFVNKDMEERLTSPDFAQTEIYAPILHGFRRGLLMGDMEVFSNTLARAREIHRIYNEKQNKITPVADEARMRFLPQRFIDVVAIAFTRWLQSPELGLWQKSRVYRQLLQSSMGDVVRASYDDLVTSVASQMPDFEQWFPEPSGMQEYREARARVEAGDLDRRIKELNTEPQ